MSRRVDVDPERSPVRIPPAVLHELFARAREALPEECCGLVLSNGPYRYGLVEPCQNEMTARHARDPETYPRNGTAAFYMSDQDVLRVRREAEVSGREVTAVYHSHVGAGAYLSDLDLEYAEHPLFPFPHADQIVLPVFDEKVHTPGVFRRCGDRFVGHPLVSDEP